MYNREININYMKIWRYQRSHQKP